MADIVDRLRDYRTAFDSELAFLAADEIERLRAALKAIADAPDEIDEWHGRDMFENNRTLARAALSQPQGSSDA